MTEVLGEWVAATPRWLLELLFLVYLLGSIGLVVAERRHPRTTLAWVLALILLPVLGLISYIVFGRRPYRRHVRRCRRRRDAARHARWQVAHLETLPAELTGAERGLIRLALRSANAPLRRTDRVRLLGAGEACFRAICDAIAGAREFVHLEFYIWRDDDTGRALTALLTERARAGVKVRILLDSLGSLSLREQHFAELMRAGGEVAWFAPIFAPGLRSPRANFRNHRKLISIDQYVGFVGGLNVGDEYLGEAESGGLWEDLFIRIEGNAVIGLETVFASDWEDAHGGPTGSEPCEREGEPRRSAQGAGPLVQIIPSGPDAPISTAISAQFAASIAAAQERCWIATPYLVPDDALQLMLETAALRGVDVRLLVPGRSDQWLVRQASSSYYDGLLETGCRIYEYPKMLHSKYLLVDRSVSAVGSANMDIRSFHLNYEITAMFYDAGVNADLAALFEHDLRSAVRVLPRDRARLTWSRRFIEASARALSPLL